MRGEDCIKKLTPIAVFLGGMVQENGDFLNCTAIFGALGLTNSGLTLPELT